MKINNFRGELTDNSAIKEALTAAPAEHVALAGSESDSWTEFVLEKVSLQAGALESISAWTTSGVDLPLNARSVSLRRAECAAANFSHFLIAVIDALAVSNIFFFLRFSGRL